MASNVIYLNRQPSMPSEPRMKIDQEIDQKSIEIASMFFNTIPDGVELDVAGVAGAQFLAGIVAFESDGDTEKALKTVYFLSNLIGVLTIRECLSMADRKSGENSR